MDRTGACGDSCWCQVRVFIRQWVRVAGFRILFACRSLLDELFENPISRSMVGTRELYLRSQLYCSLTDTLLPIPEGIDASTELPPRELCTSSRPLRSFANARMSTTQAVPVHFQPQFVATLSKL